MHWAINNNIDLVWAIKRGSDETLKDVFPNKFKKSLTFASWSSSQNVLRGIKDEPCNSEGIDSDIDSRMFVE